MENNLLSLKKFEQILFAEIESLKKKDKAKDFYFGNKLGFFKCDSWGDFHILMEDETYKPCTPPYTCDGNKTIWADKIDFI